MKKFAIIGGSFNPVTKAHVEIGQIASKELPGWQILYIPAPDRFLTSWKSMEKKEILSGEKRLLLLEKAVKLYGFLCEDCEVFGKTSARTYDTMQYLRDRYGQDRRLSLSMSVVPISFQSFQLGIIQKEFLHFLRFW